MAVDLVRPLRERGFDRAHFLSSTRLTRLPYLSVEQVESVESSESLINKERKILVGGGMWVRHAT